MSEGTGRYARPAMLFHWLTALLVLVAAGLALFREAFGTVAVDMISIHKQVGLAILLVVLFRLGWRLTHRPPPHGPRVPRWEARLAETVHRLLYALLIAVPVTGWLFVSYAPDSRPLDFRGRETIPELAVGPDDPLSFAWHEAHELMGFALIGLIGLHLAGVVRRQLVLRDTIIDRMAAPGWPRALAAVTIAAAALWLIGLSLDLFDVRLMGDPPAPLLEPVQIED